MLVHCSPVNNPKNEFSAAATRCTDVEWDSGANRAATCQPLTPAKSPDKERWQIGETACLPTGIQSGTEELFICLLSNVMKHHRSSAFLNFDQQLVPWEWQLTLSNQPLAFRILLVTPNQTLPKGHAINGNGTLAPMHTLIYTKHFIANLLSKRWMIVNKLISFCTERAQWTPSKLRKTSKVLLNQVDGLF